MAKLTQKKCETIKPKKVVKEYADGTVAGLNLAVQVSGSKAWFLRYRHAGRTRKMRLGSFPEIPLAKARQMADEALTTIRSGIDPADAKLVAKAVDVGHRPPAKPIIKDRVEDVVRQYLAFHVHGLDSEGLPKLRPNSQKAIERHLATIVGVFVGRRLSEIDRTEIHEALLDPLVAKGCGVAANRLLSTLQGLCSFALERGNITVSPIAGMKKPVKEVSRERTLIDIKTEINPETDEVTEIVDATELKMVIQAAKKLGQPFGTVVQMLVYTGQRRNEVTELKWSELNLETAIWTLPKDRTKNAKVHEVMLAPQIVALLNSVPRGDGPYVFSRTNGQTPFKSLSKGMNDLQKLMQKNIKRWTLHDLRRTFSTGAASLVIPQHLVERVLNHVTGTKDGGGPISRIYNRYPYRKEKREAMITWANYVDGLQTAK